MNKNRKLLSLICALAMIVSVFSSFTIASAVSNDDITQGITLTLGEVDEESNTIEVIAGFKGIDAGFKNGKIAFSVPDSVTGVTVVSEAGQGIANDTSLPLFQYSVSMGTSSVEGPDGVIATFLLTFSSPLSKDTELTLDESSNITDTNGVYYGLTDLVDGDVEVEAVSITLPKNSNSTTTEATRAPMAEDEDDGETLDPIVEVESGITLTLGEVDTESNTVEIIAGFVGIADGFKNGKIAFTVPDTVTGVTVASEAGQGIANDTGLPLFQYSVSMGTSSVAGPDGEIATFLLQFSEPLTSTAQVTLADSSNMTDTSGVYYGLTDLVDGDVEIVAANVNVPAFDESGEDLEEVGEIPMSDAVTVTVEDELDSDGVSKYFIDVTVKNGDDDAVYGTDYVATYNGVELTYAQYSNLINGYFNADNVAALGVTSMQDVIDNLVYVLYDENVTVTAELINAETSEVLNPDDTTQSLAEATATTAPKSPSMTIKSTVSSKTTTSVSVGKNITLTATVSNLTDDQIENGAFEYVMDESYEDYLEYLSEKTSSDNTYTLKFEALKVKSKVPVTINYVVDDEVIATDDVTIKVTSEDSSSSSSSSSSSGGSAGGTIATGSSTSSTTSDKIAFTDIDTVPWAVDAINALVDLGVINGRSNTIFDPDGTVTRAEFAKMVVLAFDLTGGDVNAFSDVDVTDWYAVYVARGYYNNVISGYDDGTFRPNGLITRQEMAAMISRAINAAGKTLPATVDAVEFEDAWQIGDWAIDSITSLQKGGVINGMTETTYEPLSNATRAQAAVIIYRAITKAQ